MSDLKEPVEVRLVKAFLAHRKRLAVNFGQDIAVLEWDELPVGLQLASIAAMREALDEEAYISDE